MENLKLGLIVVLMIFFSSSLFGKSDQQRGMSDERKLEFFEKLKNYQPSIKDFAASLTTEQQAQRGKICAEHAHSRVKGCLEDKYMDGDQFKIFLQYNNDLDIPPPPKEQRTVKNGRVTWNNKERKEYMEMWRNYILHEYLGDGALHQYSPTLDGVSDLYVRIQIKITTLSLLEKLLLDPRIVSIESVANPPYSLEEIVN